MTGFKFDFDAKTYVAFAISVILVAVQYLQDVYAGGLDVPEVLGLLLVLFGPAGLVAAVNNTPLNPAAKAVVQNVSTVVVVMVQGLLGVYADGVTGDEWFGLGLLLLSTLAVYFVPSKTTLKTGVLVNRPADE